MVTNKQYSHKFQYYDVMDFGVKGDGKTLDTVAIQHAIDTCCKNGGGTVFFPNGTYLTGTIKLDDNIELNLAAGATILGSTDLKDYTCGEPSRIFVDMLPSWEGILFAKNAKNIRITGSGTINGQGEYFIEGFENCNPKMEPICRVRPSILFFKYCSNILVEGVKLEGAAHWTTFFEKCSYLKFNEVSIYSRVRNNNDGFDIWESSDIFISNCKIDCTDDAIVLYGSANRCVINNCIISTRCSAFRIGPHSLGHFCNIAMSNCVIYDSNSGAIKLQMVEGGTMENLLFNNIIMDNVLAPISMRLSHWYETAPDGILRNVSFSNIYAKLDENISAWGMKRSCMDITGLPTSMIENVTLSNMYLKFSGGGAMFEDNWEDKPELDYNLHPDPHMRGDLPVYALYAGHVKGLALNNVKFELENPDYRYALMCDDVEDLELSDVKAMGNSETDALINLKNTRKVFIHGCRPLNRIKAFAKVYGENSSDIHLAANEFSLAQEPVIKQSVHDE
jgi:parallel beta-helix repeat protein